MKLYSMCDCLAIILPDGCWFAKNSDRDPDEPQRVEFHDSVNNGNFQQTTYLQVKIPAKKYATLISRPDWMWGAEMGVNEQGVVIGNEAVFSKCIQHHNDALLGMDLLRLALEQSNSAEDALHVITHYLEQYGQGGNGAAAPGNFYYDNSFLIADHQTIWQLETAGKFWVAKKYSQQHQFAAISNGLTIEKDFDVHSPHLFDGAIKAGLWNGNGTFNFKKTFATTFMPWAAKASRRQQCNLNQLQSLTDNSVKLSDKEIFNIFTAALRQHVNGDLPSSNADVCMHAKGLFRPSQTTQSMISYLEVEKSNVWMTGSSAPCISMFKPLSINGDNWLLKQEHFWETWQNVFIHAMKHSDFKSKLQNLNQEVENKMLFSETVGCDQLLDNWWQKVEAMLP